MITLDSILADVAEYTRLKGKATQGNWYVGTAGECYNLRSDTGEPAIGGGVFFITYPYTHNAKADAEHIAYAHNMPIDGYVTMLIRRIQRLEDALREIYPIEHNHMCYGYGECVCDADASNTMIDTILNEGLK